MLAVRPGGSGDASEKSVAWKHARGGPYVCSPLVYGDHFYVHNEQGVLTCYEAATGKAVYRERLPGRYTTSAVAGDGKLYFTNEDGQTQVVKAGAKYELLASNSLSDYCLASPAIAHGTLFVRTERYLYAIAGDRDE